MIRVEADYSLGGVAVTGRQRAQRVVVGIVGGRPAGPPQLTAGVDELATAGL